MYFGPASPPPDLMPAPMPSYARAQNHCTSGLVAMTSASHTCVSCRVLALGVGFDFSVGGKEVGVMVEGGPERICVLNGGRMARARWGWTSNGVGSGLGGALVCIEKCLALGP